MRPILAVLAVVLAASLSACASSEVAALQEENAKLRAELARSREEAVEARVEEPTSARGQAGQEVLPRGPQTTVVGVERAIALTTATDPDTGATVLSTDFARFDRDSGFPVKQWIKLQSSTPRQGRTEEAVVRMVVETRSSPGSYGGRSTVPLIVDGKRFECPVLSYDVLRKRRSRVNPSSRTRSDERIVVGVLPEVLRAVAVASEVRFGPRRLKFSGDQLMLFTAIDRRLQPSKH